MARYIDKDKALNAITYAELGQEYEAVAAIPNADVRENVRGEWIVGSDGTIHCSNCFKIPTNQIFIKGSLVYDMTPIKEIMRFCPICGADLRGD